MAGNITVIEPQDNFKKVSRDIIYNDDIDPFTLGIYVKMMTLGESWQLCVNGLASIMKTSADKIRKAFATLESAGYLRRKRVKDESGHYAGWDYEVSSIPFTDMAISPTSEKTECRKTPTSEISECRKNDKYIYRLNSNIETINNNIKTIRERFTPPSVEEVKQYCLERNNNIDAEAFVSYYQSNGWIVGKSKMKDWKAAVRTWEKREKSDKKKKSKVERNYAADDFNKYYNLV